jgi:hypothetical protein
MTTDFNCDGCCRIAVQHTCHDFVPAPEEGTSGLLPCPFCGDDCACINYGHRNADSANARNVHFAAFCCGQLDDHATYEQARAEWNRRTAQPSVSASVAETARMLVTRERLENAIGAVLPWSIPEEQRYEITAKVAGKLMRDGIVRTALTGSPREEEQ